MIEKILRAIEENEFKTFDLHIQCALFPYSDTCNNNASISPIVIISRAKQIDPPLISCRFTSVAEMIQTVKSLIVRSGDNLRTIHVEGFGAHQIREELISCGARVWLPTGYRGYME